MADNITITSGANSTPPANTVIATDDVSSVHYQVMKLGLGADGALDTLVDSGQQTMANSVPVVVASNQSSITITSAGTTIAQTPTVTAGGYSAGDAVGGLLTFANAARSSGDGGVIKSMVIIDDAGQDAALELWLFNQTFTAMSDNAAWAPSEADLENLIAVIATGSWRAAGTPSAAVVECSQRYDLTGTSLFGQLVTRGTPTFAATDDVTVKVGLLQD